MSTQIFENFNRRVVKSNQLTEEQFQEGWKGNLVALAALVGSHFAGMGQDKEDITKTADGRTVRTTKLQDKQYLDQYLRENWKLTAVQVDTIWNEVKKKAPETDVKAARVKNSDNASFQSGNFEPSSQFKTQLDSALSFFKDNKNVVLTRVDITASTDKQALSSKLKDILTKLGYSADNQGLSKARSSGVEKFLSERGVSDTIVNVTNYYEQGSKEVDDSARFVAVDFYYIEKEKEGTSDADMRTVKDTKTTYYLQKDITPAPATGKDVKERKTIKFPVFNLGSISNHKDRGSMKCPKPV